MTSIGACPHTGQQWKLQYFTFILGASPTKATELKWVYQVRKPSHHSAAATLPLLSAFEIMTSSFQTTGKDSSLEYLKKHERH